MELSFICDFNRIIFGNVCGSGDDDDDDCGIMLEEEWLLIFIWLLVLLFLLGLEWGCSCGYDCWCGIY